MNVLRENFSSQRKYISYTFQTQEKKHFEHFLLYTQKKFFVISLSRES